MPTLKQLTCHVEWSASGSSVPLQEYGTVYSDGLVETHIAVPPVSTPFSIHLKSDGYIAPGLSMFVYIDGEYQCNRGRNNLKIPTGTTQKHHVNVDFVVRQKEEAIPGGGFIGRQWRFGEFSEAWNKSGPRPSPLSLKGDYIGTIEVVVLRSAELQRAKAPNPSTSEKHPSALATDPKTVGAPEPATEILSDFGGLFDGQSENSGRHFPAMPFGGDMALDYDYRTSHHDHDRNSPPHSWNQRRNASKQPGKSHSATRSVASNQGASPAIVINVNQPTPASPPPWATAKPQPWDAGEHSAVSSWASTPVAGSVHGSQVGHHQRGTSGDGWQTWIKGLPKAQGSSQSNWKAPSPKSPHDSSHQGNVNWNSNGDGTWGKDNNTDWNNNGNYNSYNDNKTGWNDNGNDGGHAETDWGKNGSGDHHGFGDSGGFSSNNNGQDNNGWGNDNDNGNWASGQNDQGYGDDQENGNGGGWTTRENNQGTNGWNDNGYGAGDDNNNQNNTGYNSANNYGSGNGWGNAHSGAQEPQAASGQNWNTSNSNQHGWAQTGGVDDHVPVAAGSFDPAKSRNRRGSSGKAHSAVTNLTKQASINSAAQNIGWGLSNASDANHAGSANNVQKPLGPPGAWPDEQHNLGGPAGLPNGSRSIARPYHVTLDLAGNPRLPGMQPGSPVATAPLPPPMPPPPPPANLSYRVRQEKPAFYQHKVGSPKYIDTHDRPYAVFVFRYRTKAVLQQMLNITIPESEEVEVAKLANLSKEELIAEVIKTRSRMGSSSATTFQSAPTNAAPVNATGNPNWNSGPGPSSGGFGATLTDKLAALAAQNSRSSSGSDSGNNNTNHGWNDAPPGSPTANNGTANFGASADGHAPTWSAQGNAKWNGEPAVASAGGARDTKGGHVESWLDKTPAGASGSGHKRCGTNGHGSAKNGGGSSKGGVKNQSQSGSGGHGGASHSKGAMGNGGGGSWAGNNSWGDNGTGEAGSGKNNNGGQAGGWNMNQEKDNGGWNTNGNRNEQAAETGNNEPVW